ncbi:interleukin-23 receptor [Ambystoma mexicanum]|uniref:interleukin-23 receptor n=1 Tax=Ambystoma mexicanum TaxID=8296 RepID=UPI0037E952FD
MHLGTFYWKASLVILVLCYLIDAGFLKCTGKVRIEPNPVFPMGSNISIICTSNEQCHPGTLNLHLNGQEVQLDEEYRKAIQLQLQGVRQSYHVLCTITCNKLKKVVCGSSIVAGHPPESPTNVICSLYECSYRMMCAWENGRYTHIPTAYTVHLTSLQVKQEHVFDANSTSNITILLNKSKENTQFSLWIEASNALGTGKSPTLDINLDDIVIPASPAIIDVDIVRISAPSIFIQWRNYTSPKKLNCEMRYKSDSKQTWILVSRVTSDTGFTNSLHVQQTLKADSMYEFQVRCRYVPDPRYWSAWSASFHRRTPEAVPSESPEIWRSFGRIYANCSQEVTVLIKPLDPKVARGNILGYKVFHKAHGEKRLINICSALELKCRTLVPHAVHVIYVTAYNSEGDSKPAQISANKEPKGCLDCPPPGNMQIVSSHQDGILVMWEAPHPAVLGYIIEWMPVACKQQSQNLLWKRIPSEDSSICLKENLSPGIQVNISLYAIYLNEVSTPCRGHGYVEELKPAAGPTASLQETDGDKALLAWEKIPACRRGGSILKYTIYLRNISEATETQYIVPPSEKKMWFYKLNPETFYTAYIRASTVAGEGPPGNIVGFKAGIRLNNNNNVAMLLATSFGAIILTVFLLIIISRKKIRSSVKKILLAWIPIWLHEKVPKAENSKAIETLKKRFEFVTSSSLLLPLVEETLVTEVHETLPEEETRVTGDKNQYREDVTCILGYLGNGGHSGNVGTDPPQPGSGYKPQISNPSPTEVALHAGSPQEYPGNTDVPGAGTSLVFLPWDDGAERNVWSLDVQFDNNVPLHFERKDRLLASIIQDSALLQGGPAWILGSAIREDPETKSYFPQTFQMHAQ